MARAHARALRAHHPYSVHYYYTQAGKLSGGYVHYQSLSGGAARSKWAGRREEQQRDHRFGLNATVFPSVERTHHIRQHTPVLAGGLFENQAPSCYSSSGQVAQARLRVAWINHLSSSEIR